MSGRTRRWLMVLAIAVTTLVVLAKVGADAWEKHMDWVMSGSPTEEELAYDPYYRRGFDFAVRPTDEEVRIARTMLGDQAGKAKVDQMEGGWPSRRLFELVTRAETMRDEMAARYGVPFEIVEGWHAPEYGDSTWACVVRPQEGPLAGEDFRVEYQEMSDGRWEIRDNYLTTLREPDIAAYEDGVLASFFDSKGKDSFAYGGYWGITSVYLPHDAVQPDASIEDVASVVHPNVYIYVSPSYLETHDIYELRDDFVSYLSENRVALGYGLRTIIASSDDTPVFDYKSASEAWGSGRAGKELYGAVSKDGKETGRWG